MPVNGRPLIHYSLFLLKKYGFKEVLINLHYLGEMIEHALGDGKDWGLKITYSWEPELLGTGGGIKKAESFFKGEDFLVLNSDILIDVDLKKVIDFHCQNQAAATMVLRPLESTSQDTPVFLNEKNNIVGIKDSPQNSVLLKKMGYTGVQILSQKMLDYLPQQIESCIIKQSYQPAITDNLSIFGFEYLGYWNDLGTLKRLHQAELDLKQTHLTFMQ
ncbi:MAG: NDP-sugar synthase [Deltaproteobacteria bacterium]|nr:MAG: NDP-sugar synthase [Deltaproteobacteria bacterium]